MLLAGGTSFQRQKSWVSGLSTHSSSKLAWHQLSVSVTDRQYSGLPGEQWAVIHHVTWGAGAGDGATVLLRREARKKEQQPQHQNLTCFVLFNCASIRVTKFP